MIVLGGKLAAGQEASVTLAVVAVGSGRLEVGRECTLAQAPVVAAGLEPADTRSAGQFSAPAKLSPHPSVHSESANQLRCPACEGQTS